MIVPHNLKTFLVPLHSQWMFPAVQEPCWFNVSPMAVAHCEGWPLGILWTKKAQNNSIYGFLESLLLAGDYGGKPT
jgi:hypothetical protein